MFDAAQGFVGYMALNEKDLEAMDWRIQQNKPYHMVHMKWYPTSRPKIALLAFFSLYGLFGQKRCFLQEFLRDPLL